MQKWLLPTIGEVLAQHEPSGADSLVPFTQETAAKLDGQQRSSSRKALKQMRAKREWCGAIAALEELLHLSTATSTGSDEPLGLVLAGPVPVLSHPDVMNRFQTGIFTVESLNPMALMPFQLPPATAQATEKDSLCLPKLPLISADPLASEQFCVVLTSQFSLVMVVGEDVNYQKAFMYSFDPEVVEKAWYSLRSRLLLSNLDRVGQLEALVKRFPPTAPDYRTVTQFSRLLLKNLPDEAKGDAAEPVEAKAKNPDNSEYSILNNQLIENSCDIELLQAFAHEVRTPLTTIRTLTRLLLKRRDLPPEIIKRLEKIDRECTEQIDRMELFFRAAEVETAPVKRREVHLSAMSVAQVFQNSIPRWQEQASRRNLTLDVVLPQKLPSVVSNPAMLDQVLTGLIENFTRRIPEGGHIQVEVTPAGDQLKLQLQSQSQRYPDENGDSPAANINQPTLKSIGQMLMFQPETGCLSLNLNVTKNLFQALGGKLIVRQRPQQGEVLTIFLPLEVGNTKKLGVKS